jgi:transposase
LASQIGGIERFGQNPQCASNQEANVFVAGIDAHTRYVKVVVVTSMGERVLGPTRVNADEPTRLVAVLERYRPLRVVVETSSAWPWVRDVVRAPAVTFVLAHAKRLRAIAEATYKSDDIDAELLARMDLAGLIPSVYATPDEQREWATLIRHRTPLVESRTALVNRVHAQLHLRGLHLERGRLLTRAGWRWLRTEAWPRLSLEQRALVRSHRRLIRELNGLIRSTDRRITTVADQVPAAQLLATVPGIGPHRALLICAETLPIARFRTAGHLASYAGLAPSSDQSGMRGIRHGPIPAGANRWLRGALVRAAVSHVQHAPTSWLTTYYTEHKARLGWPVARIAAARKLVRAIHAMLRTNTAWQPTPKTQISGPLQPTGESSQTGMPPRRPSL